MTQIATTIEQSKDLLRLGLSPDTADMYYPKVDEGLYATCPYPKECAAFKKQESDIPAWSLSALLKVMSKDMKEIPEKASYRFVLKNNDYDAWQCNYEHPSFGELYSSVAQKTPLDAAYNMVVCMLENGHIKTEKK